MNKKIITIWENVSFDEANYNICMNSIFLGDEGQIEFEQQQNKADKNLKHLHSIQYDKSTKLLL